MKRLSFILIILMVMMTCLCENAHAAIKAGDASVKVNSTTTVSLATTYQTTLRQSTGISARWSTSSSNISITSQTNTSCTIKGVTAGTAQLNYYCSYWIDGYYRTMDFYYTVTISSGSSGPTSISISPTSLSLTEGDTYTVTATQAGAIGGTYFTTSNSSVATVSTGSTSGYKTTATITAQSAGSCYVYAKTLNGLSSSCYVTVKAKTVSPTSILVLPGTKTIEEGEYASLTATVSPSNATYSLSWSSSDTDIATVSSAGRVYGKKTGTVRITAKIDGYSLSDYCTVTVKAKQVVASSLSVECPSSMTEGETYQLSPVCEPDNSTTEYQYTSDNTGVMTVTSSGLLTAIKVGNATITVKETVSGLTKTLPVVVEKKGINVTDVSELDDAIFAESAKLVKGGTGSLVIKLKNMQSTCAYSFDLALPDGVTIDSYTLSDRHNGHSESVNRNEDTGVYSFAVLSLQAKEVAGNDGTVWTLKLNIPNDIATEDYAVTVSNAKYSLTSGEAKVLMPDVTSKLTIIDFVKGDINGDSDVDIADAVCIVNHVVGKATPSFVAEAADVNDDGDIDIADAVRIVNLIVGKSNTLARQLTTKKEPQ